MTHCRLCHIAFALVVFAAIPAQARIFDFKKETFGLYLGGSFGNSNVGNAAYANATPVDIEYDKKVLTTSSAELGFVFSGTRYNLRLGVEYLMPRDQKGVNATNGAGTSLFTLNSSVSALIPMGILEYMPYRGQRSRALIGTGYGYAMVYLSNEYVFTDAGRARFGVSDYKETASGSAAALQGFVGWEFHFADTTTIALTAGYRYLQVKSFTVSQSVPTLHGQQDAGQELTNADGSRRSMDLGGGFAGLTFRFFL